ncbi:MAG: tetratricopeptide repeat protein [bacterium]|nr:tetratricopeptide repeat protein [bacterium]
MKENQKINSIFALPIRLTVLITVISASGQFSGVYAKDLASEYSSDIRVTRKIQEFESLAQTEFNKGMRLYKREDFYKAAVKFKELTSLYPEYSKIARATFMTGQAYYNSGMYVDSAKAYKKVVDHYPDSDYISNSLYRLELCSFKMERYNAAVAYYDQLNKNYPGSEYMEAATYFGGLSYYSLNDFERAEKTFNLIQSGSEFYGFSQYSVALCYLREGIRDKRQAEGAEKAINQLGNVLLIEDKTSVSRALKGKTHVSLGQLYYELGNLDKCQDEFEKVPSKDGINYDDAQFGLGWANIKRTELTDDEKEIHNYFKKASGYMKRIIDHMPDSELQAEAYLTLAHCYLGSGNFDKALKTYRYVIDTYSLAAEFAGDPEVVKILEGIATEVENVKRINTGLQQLNKMAKSQNRQDILKSIQKEQKEVTRLLEDLRDLELWFTGRSITGGNVMLGADYGLATIAFREGELVEKELLAYDAEMTEKIGKVKEEKGRLEKEIHIHTLNKDQIQIGTVLEGVETPEDVYRREIAKYNEGLEVLEGGSSGIPETLPDETTVPDSEGETVVPDYEGETVVPDSEGETVVPDSESETDVPDVEKETAESETPEGTEETGGPEETPEDVETGENTETDEVEETTTDIPETEEPPADGGEDTAEDTTGASEEETTSETEGESSPVDDDTESDGENEAGGETETSSEEPE